MSKIEKKFIWSARVEDVEDPLQVGRIRVRFDTLIDGSNNAAILKSVPSTVDGKPTLTTDGKELMPEFKWTKYDPFMFLPLIPIFLSPSVKKGEFVNLMWPNPDSKFSEQYYIQGPLSSALTLYKEDAVSSKMSASRGRTVAAPNITNPTNSEPYHPPSKGWMIKPEDTGLVGRGTADVIVTESGVILRAGKTKTLPDNYTKVIDVNPRRSFIQLSDFNNTIVDLGTKSSKILQANEAYVKTLIEWNVLNPENMHDMYNLEIYLYRLPEKSGYTTSNVLIDYEVDNADKALACTMQFNFITSGDVVNYINLFIQQTNDGELNIEPKPILKVDSQFPIVFRPTKKMLGWINNQSLQAKNEHDMVNYVADNVKFNGDGKNGYGLIFYKNQTGPQYTIRNLEAPEYETQNNPITYNILGGDKLLILSHGARVPSKGQITLDATTIYELGQQFIVENVLPNTDSMVRGDELFKFMNLVVRFLVAHVHPFPGMPPIPTSLDGVLAQDILNQLQNASNTILNQNIRIN